MKHTQTALAVFALYGKWSAPNPVAASLAIRLGGLELQERTASSGSITGSSKVSGG